jgi:trigger factor
MKVTHEISDNLTGVIAIEVKPEDYTPQVDAVLKNYKKQASMPGFRPGMVPMGMIKKMYGNAVLGEELNKLLQAKLGEYISEEKLEILGNPLPKSEEQIQLDIKDPKEVTFRYDIGIAPQFDAEVSDKDKLTYHTVKIDDALIDKYSADLQKRYGNVEETDVAEENDMLSGEFVQLDEAGAPMEEGIKNTSTVALEFLEDEKVKKSLIGKKPGDAFDLNPETVSKGHDDMGKMLGIDHETVHRILEHGVKFAFTVDKVYRMQPAELNEEFFNKAFGEGAVADEAAFRERVSEDLTKMFGRDADQLLMRQFREDYDKKHKLELPDAFLKQWIKAVNEKPITDEQLEVEYDQYAQGLRWQLIEGKLIKAHELKIEADEVKAFAINAIRQQYAQYGIPDMDESVLESSAQELLKNEEQVRNIYDNLYAEKLLTVVKDTAKLKNKELDFDEFVKLATGEPAKKGIMNNLKSLFD